MLAMASVSSDWHPERRSCATVKVPAQVRIYGLESGRTKSSFVVFFLSSSDKKGRTEGGKRQGISACLTVITFGIGGTQNDD